jgi:tetratricopeptide (TPR) repeat protein
MKHTLYALLATACLLSGCAGPFYRTAYLALESDDPAQILAAADAHYQRGEHLSALRLVYRGMELAPGDLRFALLAGLVHDVGLDRPDLAIPEYERAKNLRPWTDLTQSLEDRICRLRQRQLRGYTVKALQDTASRPLAGARVAVYPVDVSAASLDDGVGIALTDLLLADLSAVTSSAPSELEPQQALALAIGYATHVPGPSAEGFAAWCGADLTLACGLTETGTDHARLSVRTLDPSGRMHHAQVAEETRLDDMAEVYETLRRLSTEALAQTASPRPGIQAPPVLPLSLYGQGLRHALEGRSDQALELLSEAAGLAPGIVRISQIRERAVRERSGERAVMALQQIWRQIMSHPDPTGQLAPSAF